jgi:methyl-accepting chemotaxis protein
VKLGLVKKIVIGIVVLSVVTYGCSAFFIFYLKDIMAPAMSDWMYGSIVMFLGIFWTGLLGWLGATWFTKPLIKLTEAANEAATGNLRVGIPSYRSNDEIRLLSLSFDKMLVNLRQMIKDISSNVSFTDSHAVVLSGGMTQALTQIEFISGSTEIIAKGAVEQVDSTQGTLSAVVQIKQAASEIGEKAGDSQFISQEMLRTIKESEQIISSLVQGMSKLVQSNRDSIGVVGQLSDNAKEIQSISRVVGDIADQTHLLALNASIEAARAGEHGSGFMIVAGEIRKLAEQSSTAVKNIDHLITRIESDVQGVVEKITAQEHLASREIGHGEQGKAAMDQINNAVIETAQAVENIVRSIAAQTELIEAALIKTTHVAQIANQISVETKQVASSVQEQMAVMEELSTSTEMLRNQSELINSKIKVFNL